MSAIGGHPERLTEALADNYLPAWSKDGRWIYYCSSRSGRRSVAAAGPRAAGRRSKSPGTEAGRRPKRRTEATLYYQQRVPAGWSFRQRILATGVDREILPAMWERAFAIARDGVYYVPLPGPDGRFTIQFHSFESNVSRVITTAANPMTRPLSLAPDGSFVLHSQLDRWGQDLMLLENFR